VVLKYDAYRFHAPDITGRSILSTNTVEKEEHRLSAGLEFKPYVT
jgi:hypothetical protein